MNQPNAFASSGKVWRLIQLLLKRLSVFTDGIDLSRINNDRYLSSRPPTDILPFQVLSAGTGYRVQPGIVNWMSETTSSGASSWIPKYLGVSLVDYPEIDGLGRLSVVCDLKSATPYEYNDTGAEYTQPRLGWGHTSPVSLSFVNSPVDLLVDVAGTSSAAGTFVIPIADISSAGITQLWTGNMSVRTRLGGLQVTRCL
jgi:hypothetical protein